jgi:hypothetical protein
MKQIIDGRLYNTETATEVASDRYWDGHNWERHGRNMYLYKTRKGNFFTVRISLWLGEKDTIEPIDTAEAKRLYEQLPEHKLEYAEAFGAEPEEA